MPIIHRYSISAGLLSGVLFALTASGLAPGVLMPFVPLVPLFWVGFRLGAHAMTHAAAMALLLALLTLGPAVASVLLLCFVAPSWVLGRQLLRARLNRQGGLEWYAAGNAMVALVTYAAIAFTLLGYYLAGGEWDLLVQLRADITQGARAMDPTMAARFSNVLEEFPYLIFGALLWLSLLLIYGAAWLALALGETYGKVLRPSVAILPFDPPAYALVWLMAAGVFGFFVPHETAYIPQTVFLVFLLPYFLLGLALLHQQSRAWEGRKFWLGMIYMLTLFAWWPVLPLAAWGFVWHANRLGSQLDKK